jgi:hypothetical protein
MMGESIAVNVAALVCKGNQLRAYSTKRPLNPNGLLFHFKDVPYKKKHNPTRPQPTQHGAFRPSQEGYITAQQFP